MYLVTIDLCWWVTFIYKATELKNVCFTFIHVLNQPLRGAPQPKVVTDTDETELARQLERLERENAEVDGDDDAEEMEAKTED